MQYIIGLLFLPVVVTVFLAWRKRLATYSVLGIYSCSFLVMNYVGVYAVLFGGEEVLLSPFSLTPGGVSRALLILNIGILMVWSGAFFAERVLRQRSVHGARFLAVADRETPVGIRVPVLLFLIFCVGAAFLILFFPLIPRFLLALSTGDALSVLYYRRSATQLDQYVLRVTAYSIFPYLAVALLSVSWKTGRFRVLAWICIAFACVGLLYGFQKEPLIIFIFQLLLARFIFTRPKITDEKSDGGKIGTFNVKTWVSVVSVFLVSASVLYIFTRGFSSKGSWTQDVPLAVQLSVSRAFMRTSPAYIYFAELIPDEIPHFGFTNVYTIQKILDEREFLNINNVLFLRLNPHLYEGSISSDSLVNHYGQFGWGGLVILSFLQGFILAAIDRYFSNRKATVGRVVLLLFLIRFAIYLNETHVFGAVLGFGGGIFVLLGLVLNENAPIGRRRAVAPQRAWTRDYRQRLTS